ncbi:MAG TPA: ATP-binding protein [Dissulfurispiraceae bacterium]|nr:ATP-binding protein [Dissulfurispiraceae bacterium]
MATLQFRKATKEQSKLRLAIFGPSGAGKTYTALRIATGMTGPIALIDTERGSASKYADRFTFDVLDLENKSINGYIEGIRAAGSAGYQVLIIDSLSHAWQELLDEVEKLAKSKYKGNTWSAWSEGTPKQRTLVDAILSFPGHIIGTMRSKTEWTTESDGNKSKPVRVGLAPEQGKGIEYEFDMLIEMSVDHIANVIKDRTGKYQDKLMDKPGESFGKELAAWLLDGAPPREREPQPPVNASNGASKPGTGPLDKLPDASPDEIRSPGDLKAWFDKQAAAYLGRPISDGKRGLISPVLDACFAAGDAQIRRHQVQKYLAGHSSIRDIPDHYLIALYLWLNPKKDSGGEWLPDQKAAREANAVVAYLDGQNGQQPLPLDGGQAESKIF